MMVEKSIRERCLFLGGRLVGERENRICDPIVVGLP